MGANFVGEVVRRWRCVSKGWVKVGLVMGDESTLEGMGVATAMVGGEGSV